MGSRGRSAAVVTTGTTIRHSCAIVPRGKMSRHSSHTPVNGNPLRHVLFTLPPPAASGLLA